MQEWHDEVAAGLAAVATLQRSLSELQPSEPSKESLAVYNRLLELVRSRPFPSLTTLAALSRVLVILQHHQ